ncbi:hypothetical protein BDZ97DRAFT_1827809 [Flammula alnicola]|nr:hypothetical protein BDZ97DRAFT_1827809 [Flammula alnicola]
MIATYLDPPTGRVHTKMRGMLTTWISYFFVYTLRINPRLRPENQPYFDAFARDQSCNAIEHAMRRKEILEKLGKYEEARRPLPLPPPGNPTLRAKHAANRANELANQKYFGQSYILAPQ